MKTFVATGNPGKLDEMKAIFAGTELELETYPLYEPAPENEDDYTGNAQVKAQALGAQLRSAGLAGAVLADDSGLEVAAIGGRPGVFSARYGGSEISWPSRRELLLAELAASASPDRSAKFCCALVLLLEDGATLRGYGEVAGTIAHEVRGGSGFGYDPIFHYPPAGMTFAELTEQQKNRVSHRANAAKALLEALRGRD